MSMLSTSTRRWSRVLRTALPPPSTRSLTYSYRNAFPRTDRTLHDRSIPPIPSFREELARTNLGKPFSEHVKRPSMRNQVLFFVFGSYIVFASAATLTNDDTNNWVKRLTGMSLVWKDRLPTNDEIARTKYYDLAKRLQSELSQLKDATAEFPLFLKSLILNGYVRLAQPYLDTSEGKRICWKICAVNTAIWVAWHIPRLRNVMNTRFMHHPLSGLSYTLLTSVFSHRGILHLLFNCMALTSFGTAASHFLSQEQMKNSPHMRESTTKWHFLAFFVSAGIFSGLVSHVVSAKFRYPRLVAQLASTSTSSATLAKSAPSTAAATTSATATATRSKPITDIIPSLGASGAVYGAVVMTALGFPDTEIALLVPPTFPIPIQYGVGGLVAMDILGAIRGWRYLDHWAHLGGAAFGAAYYAYGPQFWCFMREWHQPPKQDPRRP